MNSITSSAIALVIGIAIGVGGTYALTSSASGNSQLEIPTEEEARASLQAAKPNDWPNLHLSLGQCDKDTLGPGVRCAVDVTYDGVVRSYPAPPGSGDGATNFPTNRA